jgi:uncharacterized protein
MSGSNREVDRRGFLRGAAAVSGGALLAPAFLQGLAARLGHAAETGTPLPKAGKGEGGYGVLQPTRDKHDGVARIALPAGFSYVSFGIEGTPMADGNPTPKAHDGMAAFRLPNGNIRLIRNHEIRDDPSHSTIIGDPDTAYDSSAGGGTTSLEVEITSGGERHLVRDFVSLNGTIVNCAGGATPWGSWLTCEETTAGTAAGWPKPHGYVFEVPVDAEDEVHAVPYPFMGRFSHEAVAVDPVSWVVYETEDANPCGLYRFLPHQPGKLSEGGVLQMLTIKDRPGLEVLGESGDDSSTFTPSCPGGRSVGNISVGAVWDRFGGSSGADQCPIRALANRGGVGIRRDDRHLYLSRALGAHLNPAVSLALALRRRHDFPVAVCSRTWRRN